MAQHDNHQPLSATEFTPLDIESHRRSLPVKPGYLVLAIIALIAIAIMTFLFVARAVIFHLDPADAKIDVSGLSFHIGDNFLLLSGEHYLTAKAEGYYPLEQSIVISQEPTQEFDITLDPLPGNLTVHSAHNDIEVDIDGESAGIVPGTIEDIPRGKHKVTFKKYRYFPLQKEIDIEGLGRTQSIDLSLEPAWGQMQFSSTPNNANLFIDDKLIGKTPLTAEVLETGSQLRLEAPGYKTWNKQVTVKAGTSASHPNIEMIVADGTLQLTTSPNGSSITINNEFIGTTPLNVDLPPNQKHKVEVFLDGYLKAARTVTVEPEKTSNLNIPLTPNIGQIALTVHPEDAEILVNGRPQGKGNTTLSLIAKKQTLRIQKTGYKAQELKVTPRPGHKQALSVTLLTLQQAYWASRPPAIKSPVGSTLKLFRPNQTFTLGAPRRQAGRKANEAQRSVRLERPFYLGAHEISNAEFRRWKPDHTSTALKGHTLDLDGQPVVKISWQQAALFCNWLSQREGLPLFYVVENGLVTGFNWDSHGYRLPTEAEWAWAARVTKEGTAQVFPWKNQLYPPSEVVENYADQSAAKFLNFTLSNYNDGYPASAVTGSFNPNDKGLYDMSGNVAEWVNDYYDVQPTRGEPVLDARGPATGSRHVIRGASWALASRSELRMSYRDPGSDSRLDLGFRVARYVDSVNGTP